MYWGLQALDDTPFAGDTDEGRNIPDAVEVGVILQCATTRIMVIGNRG